MRVLVCPVFVLTVVCRISGGVNMSSQIDGTTL